ncbi:MAG TPA: lipid-A-disaccharide synthase [Vicinamibacterales bacterium]|jgi:lipid-A-disaccharide synthase|nr:lipid-A-disaccharide synthase [Vicinamibacterales bacterium]
MISCGEPSGDLYAASLARELERIAPGTAVAGFGGERLRAAGADLIGDFTGLSVTGLVEVARLLPRTYALYRRMVAHARSWRPDVFVAVDFPDFNFRLASAVRKLGVPVVYYISPQLWAWRPGRMKTMKRIADRVLVIFPFEAEIYAKAGVLAEWVGHPLLDDFPDAPDRRRARADLDLSESPVVGLFPGSRANEVREILPGLAAAASLIRERVPLVQFVVARAPHLDDSLFAALGNVSQLGASIVTGRADDVLAAADVALVASGTITVQAALHECPMVVVYRLSPVTYRLGKPFVRVSTYAMANLVAGRRVVPELIQEAFTPAAVAAEAVDILTNAARSAQMRADLRKVRGALGGPGASARAARAVVEAARSRAAPVR